MRTQTITQKNSTASLVSFLLLMLMLLAANPLIAQTERTVNGVISDETGPIEGATVVLKGSNIYAETDEKGAFTFPQKLTEGDRLVVHHIGYKQQDVAIEEDTSFLNIKMNDYAIIVVGALRMKDASTDIKKIDQ